MSLQEQQLLWQFVIVAVCVCFGMSCNPGSCTSLAFCQGDCTCNRGTFDVLCVCLGWGEERVIKASQAVWWGVGNSVVTPFPLITLMQLHPCHVSMNGTHALLWEGCCNPTVWLRIWLAMHGPGCIAGSGFCVACVLLVLLAHPVVQCSMCCVIW